MHDYKGCFHIHSTESDGDVPLPDIINAAGHVGLDFMVMTDHAPLPVQDSRPIGWQDGVLVAMGLELNAGGQHCVILGPQPADLSRQIDVKPRDKAIEYLQGIRENGGLVIAAHPHTFKKRLFRIGPPGWHDWDVEVFDGIEIWPYMHDWIRDLRLRNFVSHVRRPHTWITGPETDILGHWDQIGRQRRCAGIGALDNHARRFPFRRWGPALLEIFPHDYCFRTVRTHVLASEPLSGDPTSDLRELYNLIGGGRSYISYDYLADATGFSFTARRKGETFHMGDEIPLADPLQLAVTCPVHGAIRLLRDGQEIASTHGVDLEVAAREVGVFRAEVRLEGLPWIFSNPVYVRDVGRIRSP
jgi:hypothetical protein